MSPRAFQWLAHAALPVRPANLKKQEEEEQLLAQILNEYSSEFLGGKEVWSPFPRFG